MCVISKKKFIYWLAESTYETGMLYSEFVFFLVCGDIWFIVAGELYSYTVGYIRFSRRIYIMMCWD